MTSRRAAPVNQSSTGQTNRLEFSLCLWHIVLHVSKLTAFHQTLLVSVCAPLPIPRQSFCTHVGRSTLACKQHTHLVQMMVQ